MAWKLQIQFHFTTHISRFCNLYLSQIIWPWNQYHWYIVTNKNANCQTVNSVRIIKLQLHAFKEPLRNVLFEMCWSIGHSIIISLLNLRVNLNFSWHCLIQIRGSVSEGGKIGTKANEDSSVCWRDISGCYNLIWCAFFTYQCTTKQSSERPNWYLGILR